MSTLQQLTSKVGDGPKQKAKRSRVITFSRKPKGRRFLFLVKSRESYSSKIGHLVSILYPNIRIPFSELAQQRTLKPFNTRVRVFCSCQAWRYTGPAYLSTRDKYRLPERRFIENRPADTRDPSGQNFVCKHVIRVSIWLRPMTFRRMLTLFLVPLAPELKTAQLNSISPIIGSLLRERLIPQSEIDEVIASITYQNVEDVLDQYELICPLGEGHD